jgi:hypothetical protein
MNRAVSLLDIDGVEQEKDKPVAVVRFGGNGQIEWYPAESVSKAQAEMPLAVGLSETHRDGKRMTSALQKAVDEASLWSESNSGDGVQKSREQTIARLHRRELQRRLGLREPLVGMFEAGHHEFNYAKSENYSERELARFLVNERF